MSTPARRSVLKAYVASLVAVVVFPLLWVRSLRLARRHADADARGPAKVAIAIAASVGILLVGAFALITLRDRATEGMYDSLDERLAVATGESEYQAHSEVITQSPRAISIIEGRIAAEQAAGNDTSLLQGALASARSALANATENRTAMEPNHALYLEVQDAVEDRDDARAQRLIGSSTLGRPQNIQANADAAFAVKDDAVADMRFWFLFMLWPSLVGAFFAPLAFALGSILKAAFVPSDSVGFKPYPGAAAGLFLLFGAFGLPSVLFAAWTFTDAEQRSLEGQIAL